MAFAQKKPPSAKLRSAAFKRVRADHQVELAGDYVELIADLIDERGEARGTDIAMRLGVANATVVKTLKRLQDQGLVSQEPYRAIFLTEDGMKLADDGRRKHRIVEDFLLALGVNADTARIDSEGIEHHVSHETLRAMARFLARGGR
ncbi:MAG: manganese-binding transcriptional regulator MntR [Rhizobiales bacterium]|nr:manganese-binding transcriptional regulator MntR [Hyphomicrobiales bacterium]